MLFLVAIEDRQLKFSVEILMANELLLISNLSFKIKSEKGKLGIFSMCELFWESVGTFL